MASVGLAEALRPRQYLSRLGSHALGDVIPHSFGKWTSIDVSDLVAPREKDSLASKLYGQTVGRTYTHADSRVNIMLLAAHGETQSRDLQVHRPEVCYPAVGFTISQLQDLPLALTPTVTLAARQLVANAAQRRESIVYWSRVGDFFPQTGLEQRRDILRMAMSGYISDGLLMRISALGPYPKEVFPHLYDFAQEMVIATPPSLRSALVGERVSRNLAA